MADTSLSQDSSEPEAGLAVVKKKSRKKQMHSGLKEESPFPQPQPCVNGVLVQGLVSHIEEDNGCFWLQRDPDKVDGVGDMLMKGQEESYGSQDTPIKGGEIKMGSAVVAEWEGNLYRGVVTAKVGSRLLVFFVDWGNADLVGEHKVRLALQTEMQEPQLALR